MTHSLSMIIVLFVPALAAGEDEGDHWPSFRGPGAKGISRGAPPPVEWTMEKGENILWKTPIPGLGHSSPAIWGSRIFLTTAIRKKGDEELKVGLYGNIEPLKDSSERSFEILCLEKRTGEILWRKAACEVVPRIERHPKSSHANPTPATDGKRVVASFGSEGLFALDLDGNILWKKDLGLLDSGFYRAPGAKWGFGSSPVIHGRLAIVQCDVLTGSFLAAFDVESGKEVWRTPRDDVPTWSTPAIDVRGGRSRIIVNGFRHMGGYDLETGKEVWRLKGGGDIPVPTPLIWEDLIFLTSAHGPKAPIYAVRAGAEGDITPPEGERSSADIAWSQDRRGNYMQTPIVLGDLLYLCNDGGVISCYKARTGDLAYRTRLGAEGSGFTASPVAAGRKLYFTSEEGEVYVVEGGSEFKLVGMNSLGEVCMATPAVSRGSIFFRGRRHLIAVGKK